MKDWQSYLEDVIWEGVLMNSDADVLELAQFLCEQASNILSMVNEDHEADGYQAQPQG